MPEYRLYVDETGDHARCIDERAPVGARYLALIGVMMERGEPYEAIARALEDFKRRHLPYDPDEPAPVLHRKEIIYARGPFYRLQDATRREAFNADLLEFIRRTPFTLIGVVIVQW